MRLIGCNAILAMAAALVLLLHGAAASALDFTLGAGPLQRCAGGGSQVSARVAAVAFLEPAPVLDAADERWGNTRTDDGNNLGMAFAHAELAALAGRTCIGVFYRYDYLGEASEDTLDALIANETRQPFDVGRHYSLAVDSAYRESAGLKVSRVVHLEPAADWALALGVSGSILKAITYREERLRGRAVATSGRYAVGTGTFTRTRSDFNLKKFNPFVERADPEGEGYAIDLGLRLRSPRGHVLELTAMDAWSRIQWESVPESANTLDNQTIRHDVNFNRQAFIHGVDRRVRIDDTHDPRYRAVLTVSLERGLRVLASDDFVHQTHFPGIGVGYESAERAAELTLDLRTRSVSLKARSGAFSLSIVTDSAQPGDASVLGAEFQYAHRW